MLATVVAVVIVTLAGVLPIVAAVLIFCRPRADQPLHEWQCPSCGATTRARMADHQPADR